MRCMPPGMKISNAAVVYLEVGDIVMKDELINQSSAIQWHELPWGFLFMAAIVVVLVMVARDLLK